MSLALQEIALKLEEYNHIKQYRKNYYKEYYTDETKRVNSMKRNTDSYKRKRDYYLSWGGSKAFSNNLLEIQLDIFK